MRDVKDAAEFLDHQQKLAIRREETRLKSLDIAQRNLSKLKKKKGKVYRNWLRQIEGKPQIGRSEDNKLFLEERL